MADAHLANDVCVGCVLATTQIIYPSAVGGDIGCGMLSVPIDVAGRDSTFLQISALSDIWSSKLLVSASQPCCLSYPDVAL